MLHVKNPGKDFTHDRKFPFETVVKLLTSMGGNSNYKELLESQGYDVTTATSSAFAQQRDKILPYAFEFLLHEFTKPCTLFNADIIPSTEPIAPHKKEVFDNAFKKLFLF